MLKQYIITTFLVYGGILLCNDKLKRNEILKEKFPTTNKLKDKITNNLYMILISIIPIFRLFALALLIYMANMNEEQTINFCNKFLNKGGDQN